MAKVRLDQLLVDQGLAADLDLARRLILAGNVVAGDHLADKPGALLDAATPLRLKQALPRFVSRGGEKLAAALREFGLTELAGRTALDIGASTGGFTDCLLQHGAARVWAVDTGRGQMHARLREDPRVTLRENANARELEPAWLGGARVDLIAIDVAFISLRLILPPLPAVLAPGGCVVALIKPQFEARAEQLGEGGVVRERAVHRAVLRDLLTHAATQGWSVRGLTPSPLPGPAGNLEFFARLDREKAPAPPQPEEFAIEPLLDAAYTLLERPTRTPARGTDE
jgi:23S rRNA (cytidine1920-2'-O)/16S rRNA (cytidine1409-2'-O)-methyltransferase